MIKYTKDDKTLVIPSGLGFGGQSSGSGGGVTPQQAAEIASAVTEAAIDEYDIEIQVDLEELRDAISASTGTLLDLATIAAMSIADRVALFDEVFEKASNGEKIYIKGLVQEETIRTAILPLVSYRPETNPVLHQGGNLYFAAKGDTDNVYFHIGLTSEGQIDPTSGNIIKRNIYNLPTASAEVKGGVRIGSGLTMTQDTLSVDTTGLVTDGDLAPFIVQQSANTENIASLSAATEAISESLGNYATTATTDALSAVTSALTEEVAGKQDILTAGDDIVISGDTISAGVYYDYDVVWTMTNNQRKDLVTEMLTLNSQGKRVYLKKSVRGGYWFLELKYGNRASDYNSNIYFYPATLNCTIGEVTNNINVAYNINKTTGVMKEVQINLPPASATVRGGVIPKSGLTCDASGNLSVKIGEGLAFSGDTLVVSGGTGGEQNYVIVNSLSEITEPYAGLEAYRKEYTENIVYTGYTIDASQVDENYAAHIYYDGQNEVAVYHNGGGFHWDWDNDADGALRSRNGFLYTINYERTIITLLFNNPDAYVTFEEGVTTATTSTTISVFHKAVTYRYNGTAWEEYQPPKVYYLDEMTQAELVALYNDIFQYSEFTFPAGNYRFFVTNIDNDEYQGRFEIFVARFYGGSNVCFSGVMQSRYNSTMLQRGYELSSGGEFYNIFSNNLNLGSIPSIGNVSFGNDGRGGLTFDADNNCFLYDNGTVSTGDTQNYCEDLIDYNYLTSLFNRDGKFNGTYLINIHSLDVSANGELTKYTSPTLSKKSITAYTIGDYTFENEVTFKYADWELKIDMATDTNIGANLRITAL